MTGVDTAAQPFQPLRKVLAICNGTSEDTGLLAAAAALAARNGAVLRVLSVLEPPSDAHELVRGAGLDLDTILGRMADERRAAIEAHVRSADLRIAPEIAVHVGKSFIEIIRHVLAEGVDMVVKMAEPLRGAQWFLFASTDQHLLRKCPCSVWLRRPATKTVPQRVVAAVDVDLEDAAEPQTLAALNLAVMDVEAAFGDQVGVNDGVEIAIIGDVVHMAVNIVVRPAGLDWRDVRVACAGRAVCGHYRTSVYNRRASS